MRMSDLAKVEWKPGLMSTGGSVTQSEDGRWDPATVLGVKPNDRVLVAGNPAFMPWLAPIFESPGAIGMVLGARKLSELESQLRDQAIDKLLIARETQYSHDHLLLAGAHHAQLVTFPPDDGWQVEQSIEFYYPDARWWRLDSTFGAAIIAEPHGASWKVICG